MGPTPLTNHLGDLPLATTSYRKTRRTLHNPRYLRAFRVPPIHLGGFIACTTTAAVDARGEKQRKD